MNNINRLNVAIASYYPGTYEEIQEVKESQPAAPSPSESTPALPFKKILQVAGSTAAATYLYFFYSNLGTSLFHLLGPVFGQSKSAQSEFYNKVFDDLASKAPPSRFEISDLSYLGNDPAHMSYNQKYNEFFHYLVQNWPSTEKSYLERFADLSKEYLPSYIDLQGLYKHFEQMTSFVATTNTRMVFKNLYRQGEPASFGEALLAFKAQVEIASFSSLVEEQEDRAAALLQAFLALTSVLYLVYQCRCKKQAKNRQEKQNVSEPAKEGLQNKEEYLQEYQTKLERIEGELKQLSPEDLFKVLCLELKVAFQQVKFKVDLSTNQGSQQIERIRRLVAGYICRSLETNKNTAYLPKMTYIDSKTQTWNTPKAMVNFNERVDLFMLRDRILKSLKSQDLIDKIFVDDAITYTEIKGFKDLANFYFDLDSEDTLIIPEDLKGRISMDDLKRLRDFRLKVASSTI